MKIKAYFVFPNEDDYFISLGDDPIMYKKLMDIVASVIYQLKKHNDFEVCYDAENVKLFLEKTECILVGKYLYNCKKQIQILFDKCSRNVCCNSVYNSQCIYVNWDKSFQTYTIVQADKIISDISEVTLNGGNETILINIADSYKTSRNTIHVVKEALHIDGLPILIRNRVVNNADDFVQWYLESTEKSNMKFALEGHPDFEKTGRYADNSEPIYRCKKKENLWYFDNFHKDHFEVFDSQGRHHLGKAYEDLEIKAGTADPDKTIRDIML
jgi:hypothetical protein